MIYLYYIILNVTVNDIPTITQQRKYYYGHHVYTQRD